MQIYTRKLHADRPGYALLGLMMMVQLFVVATFALKDHITARYRLHERTSHRELQRPVGITGLRDRGLLEDSLEERADRQRHLRESENEDSGVVYVR